MKARFSGIACAAVTLWAAAGQTSPPAFNAARAFADLEKQVAFGPRVPQTPAHDKTREWLVGELKKSAGEANVKEQAFTWNVPGYGKLPMTNIAAQFNPKAKTQIMLCAHWDTRPTADQETDTLRQKTPIPGANDGASGVAVLLELARAFAAKSPSVGVQIVLFDGEDWGPDDSRMYLGARHYARYPALPAPTYAILIDMIGDKDLGIWREKISEQAAPDINDKIWRAAGALGVKAFQGGGVRYEITDDHLPLQQAGWKAVDLIDFDYPAWHKISDTPDKCSAESLKAVGDVLAKVVYDEK